MVLITMHHIDNIRYETWTCWLQDVWLLVTHISNRRRHLLWFVHNFDVYISWINAFSPPVTPEETQKMTTLMFDSKKGKYTTSQFIWSCGACCRISLSRSTRADWLNFPGLTARCSFGSLCSMFLKDIFLIWTALIIKNNIPCNYYLWLLFFFSHWLMKYNTYTLSALNQVMQHASYQMYTSKIWPTIEPHQNVIPQWALIQRFNFLVWYHTICFIKQKRNFVEFRVLYGYRSVQIEICNWNFPLIETHLTVRQKVTSCYGLRGVVKHKPLLPQSVMVFIQAMIFHWYKGLVKSQWTRDNRLQIFRFFLSLFCIIYRYSECIDCNATKEIRKILRIRKRNEDNDHRRSNLNQKKRCGSLK